MPPTDPNNPTPPVEDPNKTAPVTPPVTPTEPTPPVTPPATPSTPPAQPEAPAINEEAISEKVSKSVLGKLAEAFGLNKKEEEQLPTDPKELLRLAEEKGSEAAKKILADRDKEAQDAEQTRETQIQEGAQKFQTLWSSQYNELAEVGRVPKIVNKDDKNDPGNIAKVKILTKMKQIIDENEQKGIDYVPTLKEVFYENPNILRTETTAGGNVPISGGGRSTTPNNGLSYEQLHKTDIDDLVKGQYES